MQYLIFLYTVALHCSMAGMEILSWTIVLTVLVREWKAGRLKKLDFPTWPLMVGLTLCVLVSVLINPHLRSVTFQFGFMRWVPLMYGLYWALRAVWTPAFERRLLQVWLFAFFVVGLYTLVQCLTGIDLIHPHAGFVEIYAAGKLYRPVGLFSRSLAFAYSFGFSLFALSLPSRKILNRWGEAFLWIFGTLIIVLTTARGAWGGYILAVSVYLSLRRPKYLVPFIGGIALTAFVILQFHTGLEEKVGQMLHGVIDKSESERLHIWRAYFQMWMEHPLFGIGLKQGDLLLPEYYQKLGIQETFYSHAHCVYLQWLAGAGVFALALYLAIIGYFLRLSWRLRSVTAWGWSIFLAQIFFHVGAFTETNFFTAITNHMIIFNWAILLALKSREEK